MSRSRNIKPGFFKNEDLAECSFAARLCFAGLWTLADREGRLEDRSKRIKGELFAFDSIEVEPLLQELVSRGGFILRYQVGDQALIQILNFHKHQNPHHREAPSVLPAPDGWAEQPQEPEASGSSHDGKAPGEPQASPGLSPQDVSFHDGKAVLIPDSGFLIPDSLQSDSLHTSDHPSDVSAGSTASPKSSKSKRSVDKKPAPTSPAWQAYSDAYAQRYGTAPLRNPKVNSQFAQLLKRLPADEAPEVARFYVDHSDSYYGKTGHSVGVLLQNAEKLRTEWITGKVSGRPIGGRRSAHDLSGMDYRQRLEDA